MDGIAISLRANYTMAHKSQNDRRKDKKKHREDDINVYLANVELVKHTEKKTRVEEATVFHFFPFHQLFTFQKIHNAMHESSNLHFNVAGIHSYPFANANYRTLQCNSLN